MKVQDNQDSIKSLNESIEVAFNSKHEENFLESLCRDLSNSGWKWEKYQSTIYLKKTEGDLTKSKDEIRKVHQVYRDIQLADLSVRTFITNCNTSRYFKNKRVSIKSLISDGHDLVKDLSAVSSRVNYSEMPIKPYIQEASSSQKCEHTGFYLSDIWRYFRHTWSTEYRSIPGRKLNILIRDGAREFHPVIGILGLTSPVLNLGVRDNNLGLSVDNILKELQGSPATKAFDYIKNHISKSFEEIFLNDLLEEGVISYADLKFPSKEKIRSLEIKAQELSKKHSKLMTGDDSSFAEAIDLNGKDILNKERLFEACISPLFKGKRLKFLSSALKALKTFKETAPDITTFSKNLEDPSPVFIKEVLAFILLKLKNERLGANILDLSVCGSIAPYSFLLGGKLVSLLAGSPEIEEIYKKNYSDSPSIIASIMANKPIFKNAALIAVTTTSLYASGSSQYNRLKIPRTELGIFNPKVNEPLEFKDIGTSEGYGTFQFSSATIQLADMLINEKIENKTNQGTRANSTFGEGASPRLRKLREVLDRFKIPGDKILNHSYKRIVYLYPLVSNIQKEILKFSIDPEFILERTHPKIATEEICSFWYNRWAIKRAQLPEIKSQIEGNSFKKYGEHNAYVKIPLNDND